MNEHVTIDGEVVDDDRTARVAFCRAMVEAQRNIPLVPKTARADRYHYATLGSVVAAVQPHLNAAGIFVSWRARRVDSQWLEVACVLTHVDGYSVETSQIGPIPQGRNGLQDLGSAQTYLQRYTLALATGVATCEDDDAASGNASQREAPNVGPLLDAIRSARAPEDVHRLKPRIQSLPPGPERVTVIREAAEKVKALSEGGGNE